MTQSDKLSDTEALALLMREPNKAALNRFDKNFWELSEDEHDILIQELKGGEDNMSDALLIEVANLLFKLDNEEHTIPYEAWAEQILEVARPIIEKQERERVIKEIEQMDKRHTATYIVRALKDSTASTEGG